MQIDISKEIIFQTARSGGKGGQNVNKVETMVEGRWHIASSLLCSNEQQQLLSYNLLHKTSADGYLLVKSQIARTQLANKAEVIRKMNELVSKTLTPKKMRIATKPTKASYKKRLENKTKRSLIKQNRKKNF